MHYYIWTTCGKLSFFLFKKKLKVSKSKAAKLFGSKFNMQSPNMSKQYAGFDI